MSSKEKRKKDVEDTETPIIILLISFKKYQRDEANNTKKYHQQWPKYATLSAQKWRVPHSDHYWWPFLMSLNLSHWDLFENTNNIIIKIQCLQDIFSLSLLSYTHLIFFRGCRYFPQRQTINIVFFNHDMYKLCYFVKKNFNYVISSIFFKKICQKQKIA